jgi:hypothetical protein
MKELKSILGLLLLLVGAFVLYKVFPAYWGNFKMGRLIEEQSVAFTYTTAPPDEISRSIAEKAQEFNVFLAPEQVTVHRSAGDLSIAVDYTVHIEMPFYPLDLEFKTASKNHNVMK